MRTNTQQPRAAEKSRTKRLVPLDPRGGWSCNCKSQEYVVGTTLLVAVGAGVGLLFAALGTYWLAELGAFVCGVVGKLFGGLR